MSQLTEIVSLSPSTGEVVGHYPNTSEETIHDLIARARAASCQWRDIGFKGRKTILREWAHYIATHIDELAALV